MRTGIENGISDLRDLLVTPGPVMSVYFDLEVRPEQEQTAALRWHALAGRLTEQGADAASVKVLSREMPPLPGSGVLVVFAAGGSVLHTQRMPGSSQPDLALCGALPHLPPLLAWRQEHPPYVLAIVDRTGADLYAYARGATGAVHQVVAGSDDEIERNAPGGWSQMRYQHRAEDSWEHNAVRVAQALSDVLARLPARLLLLAGDVRAVQYLTNHLPVWVRREVSIRRVSGSRSEDGARQERAAQVVAETRRAASEETAAVLRELAEARCPAGRGVEGVRATLDALARGQVRTLVVAHDPQDARMAWFGPAPTDVADRRSVLQRGGTPAVRARMADVAIRAALLTGAQLRVLAPDTPGAPRQGIGALCRYA